MGSSQFTKHIEMANCMQKIIFRILPFPHDVPIPDLSPGWTSETREYSPTTNPVIRSQYSHIP